MNDYSEHIAIIGGGIAGLSLGCFLLRKDIQPIIFERSSQIREGGAGISISPNAINLLDKINLKESLSNEGADLVRVSCPDEDSTKSLKEICKHSKAVSYTHLTLPTKA